jgi:hypothetical protein
VPINFIEYWTEVFSILAIPKKKNRNHYSGHMHKITYLHTSAHAYKMRYMTFQRGGTQYWGGGGGMKWGVDLVFEHRGH